MIRLQILASGSSGNAALLRLGEQRLLLDAGLPYKRLCEGLLAAGESIEAVEAVLVTHEHRDHVCALPLIAKRHPGIRLLASPGTVRSWRRSYNWPFGATPLQPGRRARLGDAVVSPFAVEHDAAQPIGLRIAWRGVCIGLATDLGSPTKAVTEALDGCQVVLLESNYDPGMLAYGPYPAHLKRRVASTRGHLANGQARALLHRLLSSCLMHVVLVHLSGENNTPEAALGAVQPTLARLPHVALSTAARHAPSPAIELSPRQVRRRAPRVGSTQLALPI